MKFLHSKIFSFLIFIFILWMALSLIELKSEKDLVDKEISDLEAKIESIDTSNQKLEKSSAYFESPSYLEREARIKLNYKAPDEEVYFVYKNTEAQNTSESLEFEDILSNMTNFMKWFYYIVGIE